MFHVYLPIAGLSVDPLLLVELGGAVGFLAAMFGVGGGFLVTPFLMFIGVPPGVAVASGANQIAASSISGVLVHWPRDNIDVKMAAVLLAGGLCGTAAGIVLFVALRRIGQGELAVSLIYLVFLGGIGILMLVESVGAIRRSRRAVKPPRRSHQHRWIHGLPFKLRFRRSRLYISALPVLAIGFVVGVMAIFGFGGGFVLVPSLIYLLGMPARVVTGTSLLHITIMSSIATLLHASTTHTVDLMLSACLVFGTVVGARFGAHFGLRIRAEHLRAMLALLVLAVAARLLHDLVATPADLFSVVASGRG
jgi:uncharacterized membrane protein YfcA